MFEGGYIDFNHGYLVVVASSHVLLPKLLKCIRNLHDWTLSENAFMCMEWISPYVMSRGGVKMSML